MEKYNEAMPRNVAAGRADWLQMQRWLERFICGTNVNQNVVGHRRNPDGSLVTQEQFDRGDKAAHICPVVRDIIDGDHMYIEESPLTDPKEIRKHLLARMMEFKGLAPAYDPVTTGTAAPWPTAMKVLVVWFPHYQSPGVGSDHAIDQIFNLMIGQFLRQGMMLGQFYKGCPEPALHNANWKKALTSPFLAWVVRYVTLGDEMFIKPGTPLHPLYAKWFKSAETSQPVAATPQL